MVPGRIYTCWDPLVRLGPVLEDLLRLLGPSEGVFLMIWGFPTCGMCKAASKNPTRRRLDNESRSTLDVTRGANKNVLLETPCVCVFKAPRTRSPGPQCIGDPARVHSSGSSGTPP